MADRTTDAALAAIVAAARRVAVARRLQGDIETRLLQSIVDATARLFDAEAASIALFEDEPPRLEFRVAAGEKGAGAIGMTVAPTQGIAGFVYSTGQPLALSDVGSDPRFNRDAAEQTGYVPRSIAAVPLVDDHATLGVLQVLDKRSSPTFSLSDMELLAVFAGQATTAINAARVQRDTAELMRTVLSELGPDTDADGLDAVVGAAMSGLDANEESPFWQLVDLVAQLRNMSDRESAMVADVLRVVADHAARTSRNPGRG